MNKESKCSDIAQEYKEILRCIYKNYWLEASTNHDFTKGFTQLLAGEKKIAVACSGGVDSMVLAILLQAYCWHNNMKFNCLIVDHKYRNNSSEEALATQIYLEKFAIKSNILTNEKQIPDSNIEGFLRELRYELLTDFCKENNIHSLLTAHHADDNIETFLMRLERGSGLRGLASMAEIMGKRGVNIIRPFLSITKADIYKFADEYKITYFEDYTNKDEQFRRNRIRSLLAQDNNTELLTSRLTNSIKNLASAYSFIQEQGENNYKKIVKEQGFYMEFNLQDFVQLHFEMQLYILQKIIYRFNGDDNIRIESMHRLIVFLMQNNADNKLFNLADIEFLVKNIAVTEGHNFQGKKVYIYREPNKLMKNSRYNTIAIPDESFCHSFAAKNWVIKSVVNFSVKPLDFDSLALLARFSNITSELPKRVLLSQPLICLIKDDNGKSIESFVFSPYIGLSLKDAYNFISLSDILLNFGFSECDFTFYS